MDLVRARASHLVGRKITAVDFRPFKTDNAGSPRETTTDPRIELDNGRALYFIVEETETGVYGVRIHITDRPEKTS